MPILTRHGYGTGRVFGRSPVFFAVLPLYLFLILAAAAGPASTAVRLASVPALSPDGEVLVFHWRRDLWQVSSAGGLALPLTRHPADDHWPCISPDGTRIAFVSDRDGSRQLYVMPAGGGEPRQLTRHSEGYTPLEWLPDGAAILAAVDRDHGGLSTRRLVRVDVDTPRGERLLVDAYGDWGHLSPDGTRMLFVREGIDLYRQGYRGSRASQVWLADLGTGSYTQVSADPSGSRWPLWKPDGTGFYFTTARSGCFNLWEHHLETGAERQLTFFADGPIVIPTLSRDGSTLVFRQLFDFYRFRPASGQPPMRLDIRCDADAEGLETRRRWYHTLWNNNEWGTLDWSENALEMAFTTGGDLWVMDTILREPRLVAGDTAGQETEAVWSRDGNRLFHLSDRGTTTRLCAATRTDPQQPWWLQETFAIETILEDEQELSHLSVSPDGNSLGCVRNRRELWVMRTDGSERRTVLSAWRCGPYDWSPDGRWLAVEAVDSDWNADIWLTPADGSGAPFNLSRHPDWDHGPQWSADGAMLAFIGLRGAAREADIHYVYLCQRIHEEDPWWRTYDEAVAAMRNAGPKPDPKPAGDKPEPKRLPEVHIDFADLDRRVQRLTLPGGGEGGLFWASGARELAFAATIDGRRGTYTVTFPDKLAPTLKTTLTGRDAHWRGEDILWNCDGKPCRFSKGKNTEYPFKVYQETNLADYQRLGFRLIWRTMRDRFHDPNLNRLDWQTVLAKYEEAAATAADMEGFQRVVLMLLGELNASHMGFDCNTKEWREWRADVGWNVHTGHLGLRFAEPGPEDSDGLRVSHVLRNGPAARLRSRILPGEILLAVDDVPVRPGMDLCEVLNGRPDRTVRLRVRDQEGREREVALRPISHADARKLRWEEWIEGNRRRVEERSGGRLTYLHIDRMRHEDFARFEQDVFALGYGRDGLVIDVRHNEGGMIADRLLTILCRPEHAVTIPRGGTEGYPRDYLVYTSWSKPIVVLCNQKSESNAEIFCHAVKALGRGKLVGVPTAGQVIATGTTPILDLGTLRVPERTWFTLPDGRDMELNGAVPDVLVWPQPGEIPAGIDRQLDTAVDVLLADLPATKPPPRRLERVSDRQ
ncbi:MAG: PD40 domain-containing protein [Lentisphaeria bacterium]|nr:PD40 domain-containing protein [Lentisphaeria bacterium]